MKILLAGGGSGGPVIPLLAVWQKIKKVHPKAQCLLIGTQNGPERVIAQNVGVDFKHISAPKFRRYFSWKNFGIPFLFIKGFAQSIKILNEYQPDCVFGAGSFVQVPLMWAAYFKKIPVVIHQQDVWPSLANKLCQFVASRITVTVELSQRSFYSTVGFLYQKKQNEKVVLTGNPFREELKLGSKEKAIKEFNLKSDFPTLLVLGGGTGAEFLNKLIWDSLNSLGKSVQIIHATGKGKFSSKFVHENYHPYEFINNMADAYAAADFVLCRAGMSTITELCALGKLSIIVPMPHSHQEFNAAYLSRMEASVVVSQNKISLSGFVNFIRKLIFSLEVQETIKRNIKKVMPEDAAEKISDIIIRLAQKHGNK